MMKIDEKVTVVLVITGASSFVTVNGTVVSPQVNV